MSVYSSAHGKRQRRRGCILSGHGYGCRRRGARRVGLGTGEDGGDAVSSGRERSCFEVSCPLSEASSRKAHNLHGPQSAASVVKRDRALKHWIIGGIGHRRHQQRWHADSDRRHGNAQLRGRRYSGAGDWSRIASTRPAAIAKTKFRG